MVSVFYLLLKGHILYKLAILMAFKIGSKFQKPELSMRSKMIIGAVVFILCLITGCGGGKFINKKFFFDLPNSGINLAIIPVNVIDSSYVEFVDSIFAIGFREADGVNELLRPRVLREKMETNDNLINIINKIIATDHSDSDLKNNPNITNLISEPEQQFLKESLEQSSFLLVPVIFGTKSLGNYTFGKSRMRLYDISSGALIYEINEDLNANLGGDEGKKHVMMYLASIASGDFKRNFYDKY